MRKFYLFIFYFLIVNLALAQEDIQPTVTPSSFDPKTEITVVYDVTGTSLESFEEAYVWVWIPGEEIDAKYNVNPASSNSSLSEQAKFTKSEEGGKTLFTISFVPEDFFAQPICVEDQLGMLIKGNDWSDGQSVDYLADMDPLESCFVVKLNAPTQDPFFINPGSDLMVEAESSESATFTLTVDGGQVDQQSAITNYEFNYSIPQSSGVYPVELLVSNGELDTTFLFSYLVNTPSETMSRPEGIVPGINYHEEDAAKVTLCLLAPGKSAVYLLGEFNDFETIPENKMYRDGDYFWMTVDGLTSGQEYAYQYLVDGVFIADPFADKILDPDDQYIPESIYPNLKPFPSEALQDEWYKNRLSVFQTNQENFTWQNDDVEAPAKTDLVIYELLIRDFFAADDRNYLNLIDTLSYLKRLGVNAIELMPVQEFAGNNSWGYNPTFMFAPDKAYGTEEALKEFIDAAHGEGISVILDIVFNHQDIPNPYVAMWFDFDNYKVTQENPMFNVTAKHPFSVFYDMNHENELTQFYMDTTLNYWLSEYHVDGFRFDLSKGFTQTNSGSNVGQWGQYDQSRIDLLKRMANEVWEDYPETHLILEHFAENTEEKELADFGFMLWGNAHWDYKELSLGVERDISWAYYGSRDWSDANLISYMESHDEQRIMYEMLNYGQSGGGYDITNFSTALNRMKTLEAFYYTIPGPKMLWQFGELGYDLPINLCEDGTTINDGCRTSPKPVKWEYYDDEQRLKLFKVTQALIDLKITYEVFETGDFTMTEESSYVKEIILTNKDDISSPSNESEMSVYLVGNFDVNSHQLATNFPFTGEWYDFFGGGELLDVDDPNMQMILKPGEFKLFVNHAIDFPEEDLTSVITSLFKENEFEKVKAYPIPAKDMINVNTTSSQPGDFRVYIRDLSGRRVMSQKAHQDEGQISIDLKGVTSGMYLLEIDGISDSIKIIKQ